MDALGVLLQLLAILVLRWRVGAATTIALFVALLLAAVIGPYGGRCGILTVLLGFGAGLLWDEDAKARQRQPDGAGPSAATGRAASGQGRPPRH